MGQPRSKADRELAAMAAILGALDGLDGESIQRVLDYVLGRLSINRTMRGPSISSATSPSPAVDGGKSTRQPSIRDLKDEKQPKSVNQMAALVAYYLSELAEDRKDEITAADLEKYFKQAGFRLPGAIRNTLPNASAAGYFDNLGSGRYRLNPVGYNLVVHALPHGAEGGRTPKKKKASKGKKKVRG